MRTTSFECRRYHAPAQLFAQLICSDFTSIEARRKIPQRPFAFGWLVYSIDRCLPIDYSGEKCGIRAIWHSPK
jgi:hypothetical protein